MFSIFDLVTAERIESFWNTFEQEMEPMVGEELFPTRKKLGLNLEWMVGAKGLPVVLKPSNYDVVALKRPRIGFEKIATSMPFFKEAMMIDEELRQQLNMVLESGNQTYIDAIMDRIFDDVVQLLMGARSQRERMRMMLIFTGMIHISANGQNYDYDYQLLPEQRVQPVTPWTDREADILLDLQTWKREKRKANGTELSRAIMTDETFRHLVQNTSLRNIIHGNDYDLFVPDNRVIQLIRDQLGIQIVLYDKMYQAEDGTRQQYVPDGTVAMFPSGNLGYTWFGTTPEESDLMSGTDANVRIVDTGVAIATSKVVDPVNVSTKVSMISLPSFEGADGLLIADVF